MRGGTEQAEADGVRANEQMPARGWHLPSSSMGGMLLGPHHRRRSRSGLIYQSALTKGRQCLDALGPVKNLTIAS